MSDIFISYARDDRSRVEPLVRTLEAQGYSVWWDRELVPGASFEKTIDEAITAARCVVVVWSRASVESEWVQAEAGDGLDRGILVPVMMDAVRVPISFRRKHAAQLLDWPRRRDQHELEFLLRGVAECLDGPSGDARAPAAPSPGTPRFAPRTHPWVLTAAALGLLLAAAYVIYRTVVPATSARGGGVGDYSLAVLPFIDPDATDDAATTDAQARAQIAYEIAHTLGRIPKLKVISNDAVLGMLAEADIGEIRRKLKVNFLIEGSVGESAPIEISLVNTLSGAKLWRERFEPGRDPLSSIVSTIVDRVAGSLELQVPGNASAVPESAYLEYLKGRAELRRPHTEQARSAARERFQHAVALAPQFGEAYAGLCEAYIHDYQITAATDDFETAEKHCHRALTLEPDNADVHVALGYLFRYSGQYERALASYRAVLATAPFNADALRGMGVTYWDMGLAEKAEEQFKLLIEIEPGYWDNYQKLGNLYFNMGRFTDAAADYEIQSNLVRDKAPVLNNLAAAYFLAEQFERAVDAWESAVALEPSSTTYANLGSAHFFLGEFEASAKMYERAIALAPDDHRTWGSAAEAYYFSGSERYADYYAKAIELANAQLAINPNDYGTLAALAAYRSAMGQAEDAIAELDKARALNEDDIYLAYDAAIVYSRLGRKDETEQALVELMALGYSKRLIAMDANFRDYTSVLYKQEL